MDIIDTALLLQILNLIHKHKTPSLTKTKIEKLVIGLLFLDRFYNGNQTEIKMRLIACFSHIFKLLHC